MSQRSSARPQKRQGSSTRTSGRTVPPSDARRGVSLGPNLKQSSRSKLVLEQNLLAAQLLNGESQQNKDEEVVDQDVLDTFQRVFRGEFYDLPQPMSKLVRVFTSSTFTGEYWASWGS